MKERTYAQAPKRAFLLKLCSQRPLHLTACIALEISWKVTHGSAKLSCKVMSNMRPAILTSECYEEVINSASGQLTLKQLHSYFHKHFNLSFSIAQLVQEGLHT